MDLDQEEIELVIRDKDGNGTRTIILSPIPLKVFYNVYRLINSAPDLQSVMDFAAFSGSIVKRKPLSDEEADRLDTILRKMYRGERWETEEDAILSMTYHLLRDQQITYAEAAEYASSLLGRKIERDAWRMRLVRWAGRQGVPVLHGKRGRPRKIERLDV